MILGENAGYTITIVKKTLILEVVQMAFNSKLDVVYQNIKECDIVSFDVFDTLLLRNVIKPTDIFVLVELEYNSKYSKSIPFSKIRVEAEEKARRLSKEEDIHLDDIYEVIRKQVGADSEELKRLEFEMEKEFLVVNPEIKPLFDLARELGKTIYIITDMYLPSNWIGEILGKNGINGYKKLFVSGELKVTKSTGSIYSYIRKTENIDASARWIHIGDNLHSDCISAQKSSIESYHYVKPSERFELDSIHTIGDSIIRAMQINGQLSNRQKDYWYRFGWETVGPLYVGVMFWLANQLRGKDNIYFLSRDGYMPYQLYKMMREYDPELPEGYYLYASRRAIIYPQLPFGERAYALDILTAHNPALGQELTINDIFVNLEINPRDYENLLQKFGLNVDTTVNEDTIERVKQFLESVWEDIVNSLTVERKLLMEYFQDMKVLDYNPINIFDIGWRGSTHLALQRLLKKPVYGYYFGTTKNIFEEIKDQSFGYAFDRGRPKKYKDKIFDHIMIYELIFSAPEGSLIRFVKEDETGMIKPYLEKVEKNEDLYKIINQFQQGAADLFKNVLIYSKYIRVSKEFALNAINRFILSYRPADMLQFLQLTNSIGLGAAHAVKRYVSCYDIRFYLANRKKCDLEASMNLWKNAMIIFDDQGRYFNKEEVRKLYGLSRRLMEIDNNKYWRLIKKAAKNPDKVLRKLFTIIQSVLKNKTNKV